jgi:hypothetical protein
MCVLGYAPRHGDGVCPHAGRAGWASRGGDRVRVDDLSVAGLIAAGYLERVAQVQDRWRHQVRERLRLRSDAAAWAVIDVLPAHPVIAVPVAVTATRRSKSSTTLAVDQFVDAGVLRPLSESKRNRAWEANALLDLLTDLEAGR